MTQPPLPPNSAGTIDAPPASMAPRRYTPWSRSQVAWFILISATYLFRVFFMPMAGQNDLLMPAWKAHHINQGHWNIYGYMAEVYEERNIVTDHPPAAYPYGFYTVTAGWLEVLRRIGLIDLEGWTTPWAISSRALSFLLLKLPFLTVDLAIGLTLLKSAPPRRGLLAWAIWACSLSGAYLLMMGQNDLYPTLFATLGAALAARAVRCQQTGQPGYGWAAVGSMAALGIGSTFKVFPLMLTLPFALILTPRWLQRAGLLAIPVLIFGMCAAPFLSTPAFVNGVLLNFEGVRLFSPAQIFAQPVPLFAVAYLALAVILAVRPASSARPADAWLAGLVVFASQQLFSWTQFYWVVWLTPFVVALTARDTGRFRYWLAVWVLIETAFALALFSHHRDFNLGLLAGMSLDFRFVDVRTALELQAAPLAQFADIGWSVVTAAQTVARLLILALATIHLATPQGATLEDGPVVTSRAGARWALPAPGLILTVAAGVCFILLTPFVAREFNRGAVTGQRVLSAGQPSVEQTFVARHPAINGILLVTAPDHNSGRNPSIRMCIRQVDSPDSPVCQPGLPTQSVAYGLAYAFHLSATLPLDVNTVYTLSFALIDAAPTDRVIIQTLAAPRRDPDKFVVTQNTEERSSVVDMILLTPFDAVNALTQVGNRITEDGRLLPLWIVTLVVTQFVVWRVIKRAASGQREE